MDIIGQGQIMHLLSKACRGEPFTSVELSSGNRERQGLTPLIDDYDEGPELAAHLAKPISFISGTAKRIQSPLSPRCIWANLSYPLHHSLV